MRYRGRGRWVAAVVCVALVAAAGYAGWRLTRTDSSEAARDLADRLAARSLELAATEPRISRALAVEAGGLADTPTVQSALLRLGAPHEAVRLRGHTAAITVLRYASGGRLLAGGDARGQAKVWDTYTGRAVLETQLGAAVVAITFVETAERQLVAVTDGKVTRVYDVASGALVAEPVTTAAVTALGTQLVSGVSTSLVTGDAQGTVTVWDVTSWTPTRTLDGHDGAVSGIVPLLTSDDRSYLVTGGADGFVNVYDAANGQRLSSSRPAGPVTAMTASNAGDVATFGDGRVRVRDAAAVAAGSRLESPLLGDQRHMAFGWAGRLVTVTANDSLTVWQSTGTGVVKRYAALDTVRVVQGDREIRALAAPTDAGHLAAIGAADGTIHVWDLDRGGTRSIGFHRVTTDDLGFSADGSLLATRGDTGYQVRPSGVSAGVAGTPTAYPEIGFEAPLRCGAVDSRRDRIAGCAGDSVVVRDLHTGRVQHSFALPPGAPAGIRHAVFAAQADRLATLLPDGDLRVWDLAEGRLLASALVPVDTRSRLVLSPDGSAVAISDGQGMLRRYETDGLRPAGQVTVSTRAVADVAYHPGGELLATGGMDGAVRLWNATTLQPVADLADHTDRVGRVLFSPDGDILASTSADQTVQLWQVADRSARAELREHPQPVTALAFSPDGKRLATHARADGVRMWPVTVEIGSALARACASQPTWLSDDEWRQHVDAPRFASVCRRYETKDGGGP